MPAPLDETDEDKRLAEAVRRRLIVVGQVVRLGRRALGKKALRGRSPSQLNFYAICVEQEQRDVVDKTQWCFRRAGNDPRRKFFIAVEKGRQPLTLGEARVIETVCGWPAGVLDLDFETVEAFTALCAKPEAGPPIAVPEVAPAVTSKPEPVKPPRRTRRGDIDLGGIRNLESRHKPAASRAQLALELDRALQTSVQEGLCIVTVQGEQGIGKTQLIAEWWRDHGRRKFDRCVFTLDCSRLGGDLILTALNGFFLAEPHSELTVDLVDRINMSENLLIVLDGLSLDHTDAARPADPADADARRNHQEFLAPSGGADRTALRRVREILIFLAHYGARASILLGIQSTDKTASALQISARLDASARLEVCQVERLEPGEGAQLLKTLGARHLSRKDLELLSDSLDGLPISLVAAAFYLGRASEEQAEGFLAKIDDQGRFAFFQGFFDPYLEVLDSSAFDAEAHPLAYLRLLALMPGPVSKERIDALLKGKRISRLRAATRAHFEHAGIPFVIDLGSRIDINPMVRELLRKELGRAVRGEIGSIPTDISELWWIHTTAAAWCHKRLPTSAPDFTIGDFEAIEGTLYHLLAARDFIGSDLPEGDAEAAAAQLGLPLTQPITPESVTQFCLDTIVRRFLVDRQHRVTRILGKFETKARLLSLFFDRFDEQGAPSHLSLWDQADLYAEIGVCWMHAGRLRLARQALDRAVKCLWDLDLEPHGPGEKHFPSPHGHDPWRLWSETLSTRALIALRMGRSFGDVDDMLRSAVDVARALALAALDSETSPNLLEVAALRAARRVICRKAQVDLIADDLAGADAGYALAANLERLIRPQGLTGEALRRQIEVIVRRGPCTKEDMALAESWIDEHLGPRRETIIRRGSASNDVIPLYTTKIMLRRAQGDFDGAAKLLAEAERHDFVLRGECSFTARIELELERYRLLIVTAQYTPADVGALELLVKELEDRHHLQLSYDATLLRAEMVLEPEKSFLLNQVDADIALSGWGLRRGDIRIIRDGKSAVMTFGC